MQIDPLAEPFVYSSEKPIFRVLLIHGFTASPTEVKPIGEYLYNIFDKTITVESILLPGHGVTGEEGYKSMDGIVYKDWITATHKKITLPHKELSVIPT